MKKNVCTHFGLFVWLYKLHQDLLNLKIAVKTRNSPQVISSIMAKLALAKKSHILKCFLNF